MRTSLPIRHGAADQTVAQPVGQALPMALLAALARLDRLHRTAPKTR